MTVRVRFAPSPTGFLHIGSVRTALFNWLYARHTGGTFVLRIEDTDTARNTEQSLRTILDGLKWLGLDWDEGPEKGGSFGPYFQSQRAEIYKRRVKELVDKGMAYEREGAIRFKMPRAPITVPDLIAGNVTRELADRELQDPDFVIVRSDGNPVFHFVNVVDDIGMQITHVIRGEDHLSNTPKHIALFRAFGVEPPQYAHLPMILNPDGTKMSKSDPDPQKARLASLETYIDDGYVPEAMRNYLCLLGWSPKDNREVLPIDEVIKKFDLPQILRTNARFDVTKLTWINGEYIRAMPLDRFIELARPFTGGHDNPKVLGLVKEKIKLLKELPDWINYFFTDDYPFDPSGEEIVQRAADGRASHETRRQVCAGRVVGCSRSRGGIESARDRVGCQDRGVDSPVSRGRVRQVRRPVAVSYAGSARSGPGAGAVAPSSREVSIMTFPNKITVIRILLIPVFVWLTLDYIRDFQKGSDREWERVLACLIFAVAVISDGVDGYIARRYHQKSELGTFLDPLADKALLVSAMILLSVRFKNGTPFDQLPLWFPVLVISRDLILLTGTVLIHMLTGKMTPRPRLVGKCATFFQMIVLGWVLLKVERPSYEWPLYAAGFFTLVSGIWYFFDGVQQLNVHEAKKA